MSFLSLYQDFKDTYIIRKARELKHRYTFIKKYEPMRDAMDRYAKCDYKKSKTQISREIKLCWKFWGCYPLHYFREDLYRKDRCLSDEELLNYVPEFFFYELFLPFYDSSKYKILLSDKNITEQIFRSLAIPQPHTVCKLVNNHIVTNEMVEVSFNEIIEGLDKGKYKKIFVKPSDGQGGYGIFVFHRNDKGQYMAKDSTMFNKYFLDNITLRNDYIIQAGIEQISALSEIYPNSVNTFRIATENKNGNIRILLVEFRIGRNANEVDNTCQNGLNVKIDEDTGEMGHYAYSDKGECLSEHPDTHFVFKNHYIPNWDMITNMVFESAIKMPKVTYIGWDVAFSTNGPIFIEANQGFGIDPQRMHGGLRNILRISDPKLYWKNR
jgi:hypothetical protein